MIIFIFTKVFVNYSITRNFIKYFKNRILHNKVYLYITCRRRSRKINWSFDKNLSFDLYDKVVLIIISQLPIHSLKSSLVCYKLLLVLLLKFPQHTSCYRTCASQTTRELSTNPSKTRYELHLSSVLTKLSLKFPSLQHTDDASYVKVIAFHILYYDFVLSLVLNNFVVYIERRLFQFCCEQNVY